MRGIQFVVDEAGKKKAVLIDLEEWGELWEDFCDVLVSQSRKGEEVVKWEEMKGDFIKGTMGTSIASESSLKKDWLSDEEYEAWQDL
jgi:hypothetical protein